MKKNRIALVLAVVMVSMLLASCGSVPNANWPGLTVDQDIAYVADGSSLTAVYAAGTQAGTQKWRFPADKLDPNLQIYAAPAISNGMVLVGSENANSTIFYALDAALGTQKWTFTEAKGKWLAGAVVGGDLIIAPNSDGHLYALGMDGKLRWKFQAKAGFWATPVTDGTLVFAPSQDRNLYAIKVANGEQAWSLPLDAAGLYTPILNNGTIYLSTLAKQVLAINSQTGKKLWTATVDGTIFGSPILVGDNLYIADENSKLYAFVAATGAKVGDWATPGPVTATVGAFSKGILVVTEAGDVVGFSETGEKLFSQKINGKLYTRPAAAQDLAIVAVTAPAGVTIDNLLIAYDSTGKQTWSLPVPK